MKTYSQSQEDLIIANYFGNYKGTLLEIGSNNGRDLSNSLAFIEQGWLAHLVEPGLTFTDLSNLHANNSSVKLYNYAIGKKAGKLKFYESGAHVLGGTDNGLVSSLDYNETERWRNSGVEYTEREVKVKTFAQFYKEAGSPVLDYISIDAEGYDLEILEQIDLAKVGCKCLIVEWNSDLSLLHKFNELTDGYRLLHQNNENLIYVI